MKLFYSIIGVILSIYIPTEGFSTSIQEFEADSLPYKIPGVFITPEGEMHQRLTIFWCHGGPHASIHTDIEMLKSIAQISDSNVVGFDFRGSILGSYENVMQGLSEVDKNKFYYSVDKDYGGGHMDDLKAVVEYIKNRYSQCVDSEKLVIAGYSFGGYMAAMAVTDPTFSSTFMLGVLCSGFYDLGEYKAINCPGEDSNPEIKRRRSPFSFTQNIMQPLLLIHGGIHDKTTLVNREDAQQFLKNALANGRDVESIFMDEEGHDYSEAGWAKVEESVANLISTLALKS